MKILAFPKDANPYQELLYSEVRKQGIPVSYLEAPFKSATAGLILRPLQLLKFKLEGYTHFHLHWLYPFRFAIKSTLTDNILTKAFFTLYFVLMIYWLKLLGYKIIWTVHNILPHDKTFIDDLTVTKFLAAHADTVIAHSQQTIDEMKSLTINTDRCTVIPHGSYIGIYPNTISLTEARERLQLPQDAFVILFLGRIEPYKGIPQLLNAFAKASLNDVHLVIAGQCKNKELKDIIHNATNANTQIHAHIKFIEEDELQIFLNAADTVAFPFKQITTSGSIILALSYGKPVIYPDLSNLKDLPKNVGFCYDNIKNNTLTEAIINAYTKRKLLEDFSKNATDFATQISWKNISEKFIDSLNSHR